jgi:cyclase
MPLSYGGGIRTLTDISSILRLGVEKVSLNASAISSPDLISAAAALIGSQSIVVSIDVRRNLFGKYEVCSHAGRVRTGLDPVDFAIQVERLGAGEILLNSIDRDGTMEGYDLPLIRRVSSDIRIPVIACGGAGTLQDLAEAVQAGASAVAAGSLFVFYGRHRAVLINYPPPDELRAAFQTSPERS